MRNLRKQTLENKYISRIIHSNTALAFCINLLFMMLVLLFCDLKYEVSDDFVMASILSGAYGNSQNPHLIFINVLIGYLLIPFYKIVPQISWYFILQFFLVFISSSTVTYVLLKKLKNSKEKAIMLSVILILIFSNDAYILMQFTKTAMFAVFAGSILFVSSLFHNENIFEILFGALLCLMGTFIRFNTIYIAGGFLLFILLYEFIILFRNKKEEINFRQKLLRVLVSGGLLISIAFGCEIMSQCVYNSNDAYKYFYDYNSARSKIVDFEDYGYAVYAEELTRVGISENDYYALKTWHFADNDVFTLDKLEQTAAVIKEYYNNRNVSAEQLLKQLQTRNIMKYPVFITCIILLFLGIFLNPKNWWTMLGSMGIGILYLFYFSYRGRLLYRIEYAVFLGIFLCGVYFWNCSSSNKGNVQELIAETPKICVIIAGLFIAGNIILYIPDSSYKSITSENRKGYVEASFYASANYDLNKYRTIVNKNKPSNGLLEEIKNNKENFYFLDFTTTIQTLYFEWAPWESLPTGEYKNYMYLSGVTSNFPDVVNLLKANNLENPMKSLVNENVYVVDNCYLELKLNYLKEHYYPEARAEFVQEIDGYQIWKFYSK